MSRVHWPAEQQAGQIETLLLDRQAASGCDERFRHPALARWRRAALTLPRPCATRA